MVRKTKADAELTRQQIIDAARRVFAEKGVSRTTIDNIASAAGVTRGAVYWHFDNKEELFHAMREQVMLPLLDKFDGALFKPDEADPLGAIEAFYQSMFESLAQDSLMRHSYEIMILKCEYVEEFAHVLERMLDHCSDICTKLARAYAIAAEKGQLRPGLDPDMAACDTYVFIGGLLKTWLADYAGQTIRCRTAELIRNHVALRRR